MSFTTLAMAVMGIAPLNIVEPGEQKLVIQQLGGEPLFIETSQMFGMFIHHRKLVVTVLQLVEFSPVFPVFGDKFFYILFVGRISVFCAHKSLEYLRGARRPQRRYKARSASDSLCAALLALSRMDVGRISPKLFLPVFISRGVSSASSEIPHCISSSL
jgi:hypothetical protein